jgi:hypothetical protein
MSSSHPLGKYTNSKNAMEQLKALKRLVEPPLGVKYSIKKLTSHEIIKFIKFSIHDQSTDHHTPIEDNKELEQHATEIYDLIEPDMFYVKGMKVIENGIALFDNYKEFINKEFIIHRFSSTVNKK